MSPLGALLVHLQAGLSRLWSRERGEVTFTHIFFFFFLVAIWKLFPGTFLSFFAFLRDMLFGGIHQVQTTGKAPSLLQQIPHHSTTVAHDGVSQAAPALKAVHTHLQLHRH